MDEVVEQKVKRPKTGGAKKGSPYNRLPPMLHDVRWAYRNVDKADKKGTKQQERFRQMFNDKPEEFIKLLQQLEREHKAAKKQEPKPVVAPTVVQEVVADVGADKALELARRWLADRRAQQPRPSQP